MGLILRQERKTMIHSALEHSSPLTVRSNKLQKGSKCGKIRVFTNRVRLSEEIFVCGLNSGYVGFSMQFDIVIIGAGAAGLFAAIWAGRTAVAQGHALSIVAILLAAKMGIAAGGRGGWIVVPPLLVIAALLYKGHKAKILGLLLVALLAIGGVLATNQIFRDRLTSIYSETTAWFAGDATAGGSGRLTIMAISWELIKDNPLKGYASKHNLWGPVYQMDPSRYSRQGFTYESTEYHRFTLCDTGEHNQYLHEWLMSGIFGILAISLPLVVPLVVFLTRLRGGSGDAYAAAVIGIGFVVAFMVFGFTQGPFSYKVIASFYGFMIAGLASCHAPRTGAPKSAE